MLEKNGDIFNPPKETIAVCIPVSCELDDRAAVMSLGYSAQAKQRWPGIERVVGYFSSLVGTRTHILTWQQYDAEQGKDVIYLHGTAGGSKGSELPYHLLSFPTRTTWKQPPNPDLIIKSARELVHLVEKKELLQKGNIVIPRLGLLVVKDEKQRKHTWESIRKQLGIYLDHDRYVILEGNRGTPA